MATKTFTINGREKKDFELTNQELVDLIRDENTTQEDKDILVEKMTSRFEYDLCPHRREGETENDVFARFFSNYVNGKTEPVKMLTEDYKTEWVDGRKAAAMKMAQDHRYLQNEMFKVCLEYIKILAENCDKGYYDPRNEWACKTSKEMIDHLKDIDYWF